MIRKCSRRDIPQIYRIVNEAAKAYDGVIPGDCYHTPYMPEKELICEFGEMTFYGFEEDGRLLGVSGLQAVQDVTLIRHTYVLPEFQGKGIGGKLIQHLKSKTKTQKLLVGTWATASWAIKFYEKNGFKLMKEKQKLLRRYWCIPENQVKNSVVLGLDLKPPTKNHP
jgi:GNAT superfamily N-acetyltransferase